MTQLVTSSPSLRQASGFLSRRLQSRKARFCAEQVLAICRLTASSTEDTGTGASASAIAGGACRLCCGAACSGQAMGTRGGSRMCCCRRCRQGAGC